MREHEVPTHVQAEDRVLLGFTFPQVVAVMAVCAISYGAYRYAPVGPSEVRTALAVVLGLVGVAMIVGKIGGRRLPLVAADLLKYRLGARRYTGPASQLVRSEPPAPPQPANSGPGPLRLMARRAGRSLPKLRKKTRKNRERRNGRKRWFGKRRVKDADNGHAAITGPRPWRPGSGSPAGASCQSWPSSSSRRRSRPCPRPPWPTATGRTRSTSSYRSRWKAAGYSSRA